MADSACRALTFPAIFAATFAVLILSAACGPNGSTPETDGPVAFEADPALTQTAGFLADAGDTVVFGANLVQNGHSEPATLTNATLLGEVPSEAAEVAQVRVLDPAEHDGELIGAGPWPYEHYATASVPLRDYTLPGHGEAELLFVVRIKETGTWHWPRTRVTYEANGRTYTDATTVGFIVCPTTTKDGVCEPT